jgi:hypothetical protein
MDFIRGNIELYERKCRDFQNIFGTPLKPYWDNITGFDIVRFDEKLIKSPNGKSISDVVLERYGKDAVELVEALLK